MAGVLLLVGVCAPPGVWEYDAAWAARHPTDHDAIARAVAPDIFSPPPLGVPLGGPAFNASFANPCWHEEGTRKLRCLPAFYLIGGFQCAVHDLGRRIALSADAVTPANMFHAFWSSGAGFGGDWGRFVRLMDKAVPRIQRQPRSALAFIANPAMLAFTWAEHARVHDSFARTVGACWKRCRKELQPSEVAELCKDKKYKLDHCLRLAYEQDPASAVGPAGVEFTLPQLMRRAHGANVKLVALLRNPADRLWSAFFSYGQFRGKYGDGEAGVAAYFAEQSAAFARCASRYDRRTCALRLESLGQAWQDIFYHCDQLIKSMYSVFVHEWQLAFGPARLLLVRSEEYMNVQTTGAALGKVLRFVGLPSDDAAVSALIAGRVKSGASRGTRATHARSWTMSVELRARIDAFYAPFNDHLAELSGDDAYRRWPVHMPATTPDGSPHR